MTSASNQMITRCPKCGTAFRVTPSQLQSAKGSVRCGSCLNVFKAQEYVVAVKPKTELAAPPTADTTPGNVDNDAPVKAKSLDSQTAPVAQQRHHETPPGKITLELKKPNFSATHNAPVADKSTSTQSAIKSLTLDDDGDDILISDDMEESPTSDNKYEFDSFMDIDIKPSTDVSLFERKIRPENDRVVSEADESWAEMLIDEEEEDSPQPGIVRPKSDEELADEALMSSNQTTTEPLTNSAEIPNAKQTPGLVFSLIGETDNQEAPADDFVFSEELSQISSHQGFKAAADEKAEEPTETATSQDDTPSKRQVKTQPKIRAYDGSRAALLMNIIPAPIEFTAKSMRRWYQRKLWATLSILALMGLAAQIAWFKFDSLSRIEPYRTAYLFICPYLGCELPTLIDTRLITTSNLVVREHPTTENALAVDVMIINGALFDQPFPDLVLVFSDIDDNLVASRRFTPKDYLGGELVGRDLMPQNQKVYITLDIVDPGTEAVNYRIYIPQQ
jgi:predicted Zn finger-like uncharacterized protein